MWYCHLSQKRANVKCTIFIYVFISIFNVFCAENITSASDNYSNANGLSLQNHSSIIQLKTNKVWLAKGIETSNGEYEMDAHKHSPPPKWIDNKI